MRTRGNGRARKVAGSLALTLLLALLGPMASQAGTAATFTASPFGPGGTVTGVWEGQATATDVQARVFNIVIDASPTVAFCIEVEVALDTTKTYDEIAWDEANVTDLPHVTAILQQYPPSATMTDVAAMATQAAIWHFSDGFRLQGAPGLPALDRDELFRSYNAIIAWAEDNPVTAEPPPSLDLQPEVTSGVVGLPITFLLTTTGTGPVAVSVSGPATRVACNGPGPAPPILGPLSNHPVCVLPSGVGQVVLAASTSATAEAGRVFFHPGMQKIVLGASTTADATDSATATIDEPRIELGVDKSGPALSKVGDLVTWEVTVTYADAVGAPRLHLVTLTDTVADDADVLVALDAAGCATLDPGDTCTFTHTAPVPLGAPDPLVNELSLTYAPAGVVGPAVTASDDHPTNLFQPGLEVEKAAPSSAQAGEAVVYEFTLVSSSSADAPDLVVASVLDDVLGDLTALAGAEGCDRLSPGGRCSFTVRHVVDPDGPDPLENVVTVTASPDGFPNVLTATDHHTLDVHDARLHVDKVALGPSKVGDPLTWQISVSNTSRPGSPDLVLLDIVDLGVGWAGLGDLTAAAPPACQRLAPGQDCSFEVSHVVAPGDPDPLENRVTARYHPEARPDLVVSDTGTATAQLFTPAFAVEKSGPTHATPGQAVPYAFEVINLSSADSPPLIVTSVVDDVLGTLPVPPGCLSLAPATTCQFGALGVVPTNQPPGPLVNVVTVTASPDGFPNVLTATDDHVLDVLPTQIPLSLTVDDRSKVGDDVTWTVTVAHPLAVGPDLDLTSLLGTVLGDLGPPATAAGCDLLLAGTPPCTFSIPWTVPIGAPDPVEESLAATWSWSGVGAGAEATTTADLPLFIPGIGLSMDGPDLAYSGDVLDIVYRLTNRSTPDAPDLVVLELDDDILGDLLPAAAAGGCDLLAANQTCEFTVGLPAGTIPGAVRQQAQVVAGPVGFPNRITAAASHEHLLVSPSIDVDKEALGVAVTGQALRWEVTVTNTSSVGTPTLELVGADDAGNGWPGLGDVSAAAAGCFPLATGASCSFTLSHVVTADLPAPLTNTIEVIAHPRGRPDQPVRDTDSATAPAPPPPPTPTPPPTPQPTPQPTPTTAPTTAPTADDVPPPTFEPLVTIGKTGPDTFVRGESMTWTFTIFNASSPGAPAILLTSLTDVGVGWAGLGDLAGAAASAGCGRIPVNLSCRFEVSAIVPLDAPDPSINVVSLTAVPEGFPDALRAEARHTASLVSVLGEVEERPDPEVDPAVQPAPDPASPQIPRSGAPGLVLLLTGLSLIGQGTTLIGASRLAGNDGPAGAIGRRGRST